MIKAVIFDLDDTLIETYPQIWKLHKHVAKEFYNVHVSDEKLRLHWGKPLSRLMEQLYDFGDTVENMSQALVSVAHKFPINKKDGAVELVNILHGKDIRVGIVSSTRRDFMNKHLNDFGFPVDKFFAIQTADDTEFHKPNPKVFEHVFSILEKEGIKKNEITYVGDSMMDFEAASQAGINFIGITTGIYSKEDFNKNGAEIIVSDIKEVINFLDLD